MADDEQDDEANVRHWVGRLEAFASALGDIEGDSATEFADNAFEAWSEYALPEVTAKTPAALLIVKSLNALGSAASAVWVDWAETPDVRDRYTRETAQQLVRENLDRVLSDCKRWLSEGLPSSDDLEALFTAAAAECKKLMDAIASMRAELDAQEAEAEADPYGAILIHLDLSRCDAPIIEKVCSLTEDDDKRYRDAYERIRKMLDSELLGHVSDESDRFLDQLVSILEDLRDNKISIFDRDAGT